MKQPVETPNRPAILDDAEYLVEKMIAATSSSRPEVVRRLAREHGRIGSNVAAEFEREGLERGVWSEKLGRFYEGTDSFLYESIVWNRTEEKCRMRRWIADWIAAHSGAAPRILVYGDGPGFDSLTLRRIASRVHYFEISDPGVRFARCVFADQESAPAIVGPGDLARSGPFDVVVCLDVLEHVPDPAELVASLADCLADGGHLIVHAPFWYHSRRVPTHLRAHRGFSGDWRKLYARVGFVPVGGRTFWNPIVFRRSASELEERDGKFRWRLIVGGLILSIGRWTPVLHSLIADRLIRSPTWPELDRISGEAAGSEEHR